MFPYKMAEQILTSFNKFVMFIYHVFTKTAYSILEHTLIYAIEKKPVCNISLGIENINSLYIF